MADVVTLGEAMLRLSPPDFHRLEQAHSFSVFAGGGEFNVAIAVARLGLTSCWLSKLPDNDLGRLIRNKAREQGVDTQYLQWEKDGRAGIYYLECGAAPRPGRVIYDRAGSSASKMNADDFSWSEIFSRAKWFHVSGITPALSPGCAATVKQALIEAKKTGCLVSYDLNYRTKLWSAEDAGKCQEPYMSYVDVLISTETDTEQVFKLNSQEADPEKRYQDIARQLKDKFGFKVICITLRKNISVWKNLWGALAYDGRNFYTDELREVEIADRIGAGDSFAGAFIWSYLTHRSDLQYSLKFANAFSAYKHSVPGDYNICSREEIEQILQNNGVQIQR